MPATINASWEILFIRHRIVEQIAQYGSFRITASQINTVHEARLMAKFDVKQSLPAIFRAHQLSILPISRGEYVIGGFETHHTMAYHVYPAPRPIDIPHLDTLNSTDIHSESEAIRMLQHSGVLCELFEHTTIFPTLQGRRGSGQFAFHIADTTHHTQTIHVDNAQIEIDACFETPSHIFICEAKNQLVHDLLVRQLYYPYRFVTPKSHKTIVPVSIIYNNYTFYVTRYAFADVYNYNSLTATQHYCYTLDTQSFQLADIHDLWLQHELKPMGDIPFPQADDMRIMLNIVRVLAQRPHSKTEITEVLGYDKRQTDYYVNAARWLGFIEDAQFLLRDTLPVITLSTRGNQVANARPHQQKRLIIAAIVATPCFREMVRIMIDEQRIPDRDIIVATLATHPVLAHTMSGATRPRRAQTVQAWLRWMLQQVTH